MSRGRESHRSIQQRAEAAPTVDEARTALHSFLVGAVFGGVPQAVADDIEQQVDALIAAVRAEAKPVSADRLVELVTTRYAAKLEAAGWVRAEAAQELAALREAAQTALDSGDTFRGREALRAALAATAAEDGHRFDHDGMWRHHHADPRYWHGEAVWWTNVDEFGGEKREHTHAATPAEGWYEKGTRLSNEADAAKDDAVEAADDPR